MAYGNASTGSYVTQRTTTYKTNKKKEETHRMPEAEYLSLAELELLEQQELEGFRPEADANASLPPIPAGNYQARVTYANDNEPDKIWVKKQQDASKGGKTYYMTQLRLETVGNGGEFDGRTMSFYASTLVFKGSGTTSIQQVLQPLGFGEQLMTRTRTVKTQIDLLNEALEGGQALVGIKVDWEAQVYDKEKDETTFGPIRGMKKFPLDANGNPAPEIFKDLKGRETPTGEAVMARNFIRGFVSLDSLSGVMPVESDEVEQPVEEEPATEVPVVAQKAAAPAPRTAAPTTTAPRPAAPIAPQAQGRPTPAPRPTAVGRPAPARRS